MQNVMRDLLSMPSRIVKSRKMGKREKPERAQSAGAYSDIRIFGQSITYQGKSQLTP